MHSPEIDYLRNGVNGVIVEDANNPGAYAQAIIHLLGDEYERQKLVEGCRYAREIYTVEAMVNRFSDGIRKAIS